MPLCAVGATGAFSRLAGVGHRGLAIAHQRVDGRRPDTRGSSELGTGRGGGPAEATRWRGAALRLYAPSRRARSNTLSGRGGGDNIVGRFTIIGSTRRAGPPWPASEER